MKSRQEVIQILNKHKPVIAPSMLKCDFGDLNREIAKLTAANAHVLHWDVMDADFVPNLSYGAMILNSCRAKTNLIYDAHLMMRNPEKYLPDFLKAGCEALTFHIEAVPDPVPLLQKIKAADRVAGLSINPKTPVELIKPYLNECDLILVMSVEPGFGGQKFIPSALDKLKQLKGLVSSQTILSVDGGVAEDTISSCAAAGAGLLVCGSSVFDHPDYDKAIDKLVELAKVPG